MKNLLIKANIFLCLSLMTICAHAQSGKVVIGKGGIEARYLGESKTMYHCGVQDDFWISKTKARVIVYRAVKGQGFVIPNFEKVLVYQQPRKSKVLAIIVTPQGDLPDCYRCLGVVNNYYKVQTVRGIVGYVLKSRFFWDSICTF